MLPGFLNDLALKNAHLIENDVFNDDVHLASTFQPEEIVLKKTASFFFERVDQYVEMHQNSPSPDFWIVKSGKVIRSSEADNEQ